MMFSFCLGWLLVCLLLNLSQQNGDFNKNEFNNVLYQREGNVSVLGIFENHFGRDCQVEAEKGLEEIASAIWTVEALNNYHYLPGITIGLTLFGVCEHFSNQKILFGNLERHLRLDKDNNYIGALTSQEIYKNIPSLENNSDIKHIEHIISANVIIDAVIQLLINLKWTTVNFVISDSYDILKSYREKASEEGVVTHNELLINSSSWVNLRDSGKIKLSSVIIVIASFANISNINKKLSERNTKLILSPTDFVFDPSLLDLPNDTIVSLPFMENKTALTKYIKNVLHHKMLFNRKHPQGPLFIETAASILKLLKPFKSEFDKNCEKTELRSHQPCASVAYFLSTVRSNKIGLLSQKSMEISPDDVEETLKVLKIESSSNDEMFLYISSVINDNAAEDLAIFKVFSLKTKKFQLVLAMINDSSLKNREIVNISEVKTEYFSKIFESSLGETETFPSSGKPVFNLLQNSFENDLKSVNEQFENNTSVRRSFEKKCELQGAQNQMYLNLAVNYTTANQNNDTTENNSKVVWRFVTWVSINTSLGFVGVTCTLSTMLFLIIKLCKRDMFEGSPYFTLLLMLSVILTYISSLPFHVEFFTDVEFFCNYRKFGPPITFAILFSLLLSRSILLAFEENGEEFSGHVNGYLQFILCIFMFGIQVSLVTENWISKKPSHCADVYNKYKIFFFFSYDFLLLMLLACVSPFILRSKLNYKEGLLFSITVFFITIVWSTWFSFYVLLPNEYKDAAVAIGLNSTASVFLFCIFIPQTYFMAEPFNREAALRSFSSLSRNILTDVNFKSKQSLNESAFGTIIYKNCETGMSNPTFLTSRSIEGGNPNRSDNFANETDIQISSETSQLN